jgi:ABC-2 type transport system permease protein
MRLFAHQLRAEQVVFWRNREASFFIFAFPIVLFLLLGSVYDGDVDGYRASDLLLVGILGYGAATTAFAGLAILLVVRREMGLLKRVRATPLPAATYLAATLVSILVVFALEAVVVFALGMLLFDADGPERIVSLTLVLLVGAAAFAGLGLAAASLIRSADGVSAVVNLIVLPMAFLSGSFVPSQEYPQWLQDLSELLPLKHLITLVTDVYLDGETVWHDPVSIVMVLAWGAAGLVVAARYFGWEPRER